MTEHPYDSVLDGDGDAPVKTADRHSNPSTPLSSPLDPGRRKCPTAYNAECIERLDDNLFVVHATSRRKLTHINKNMVVLRHNKRELTLINPVQLEPISESKLLKLGTIQRIIRLAPTHGHHHDWYYLQRFPRIRRWAPVLNVKSANDKKQSDMCGDKLPVHRVLSAQDDCLLPGCHVFCFQETSQPECAILVLQDYVGNLLVTAQVLQSHRRNPRINVLRRAYQTAQGLMQAHMVIPSLWLRTMSTDQVKLRSECERLLRLDFERLVSAEGVIIHEEAKEYAVMAIELAFPSW